MAASFSLSAESGNNDWDEAWDDSWDDQWQQDDGQFQLTGFVEQAIGSRIVDTDLNKTISLQDSRIRLEAEHIWQRWVFNGKADVYYDGVLDGWREQLREISAKASFAKVDVKLGRQILTWGTGDYLFLNDLFAKDWQSFFSGREDEYLKAPTNAVKISYFHTFVNVDVVWTPSFESDNYINGDYFSFYDRRSQSRAAPSYLADQPNGDEWALRLYKTLGRQEVALYGYDGYFKSPNAINNQGQFTFSRLRAWGFSWRQPLASGLLNLETSYYQSLDDRQGDDPQISNSQWRWLAGYERELITRLTGALQLYLERTLDYGSLRNNSPTPSLEVEENRTLITTRLNWRSVNDKLTLGLFVFYSPSDRDSYWRPTVSYRVNDHWQIDGGVNWFTGQEPYTFFGQFEENSNLYGRVRYSF